MPDFQYPQLTDAMESAAYSAVPATPSGQADFRLMWDAAKQAYLDATGPQPTALEEFNANLGQQMSSPLERLRFFCSLAMKGQDWLDVETLFDDIQRSYVEIQTPSQPLPILDPDYARIYSQMRCLAWSYGYACMAHGSFTRDFDLLLVPWSKDAVASPEMLINHFAESCGLRLKDKAPTEKLHGRKAWTMYLPGFGEPRWIDLSFFGVADVHSVHRKRLDYVLLHQAFIRTHSYRDGRPESFELLVQDEDEAFRSLNNDVPCSSKERAIDDAMEKHPNGLEAS